MVVRFLGRCVRTVHLERCRKIYDLLDCSRERAKTRTWNLGTEVPERMGELGANVWNPEGLKVLGTPVGTPRFHQAASEERLQKEEEFWRTIPWVRDLGPRCHHVLRTAQPSFSAAFAAGNDRGMQQVMIGLLERLPGDQRQQEVARTIESLPMRMGFGHPVGDTCGVSGLLGVMGQRIAHAGNKIAQVVQIVTKQRDSVQAPGCWGEVQRDCRSRHRWFRDQNNVVRVACGNQRNISSSLNYTFGGALYLPSLLPLPRLICDRTQAEERARFCA